MSAARHTSGPWKDGPVFQRQGRAIFFTDTSKGGRWNRRLDEGGVFGAADARLIAAAPDLLEALLSITDQLERIGDTRPHKDGQYIEAARAAIAKATDTNQQDSKE